MCDYSQRMDASKGDLTDIIRNRSLTGAPETDNVHPTSSNKWQLPQDSSAIFQLPAGDVFTDQFMDSSDPVLHELARTNFFNSSEASGGGSSQKMLIWEEGKRPSSNLFSRMPQISQEAGRASAVIGQSPLLAPDGATGPVEISSARLMAGIKRRKSQAKKVVCVPAPTASSGKSSGEVVPSDLWAWRKYGQKPIKGSPYPRGYYRCSSSKGCPARKQVERSRTDPNMLVITYSSEHNHPWPTQRNALAGSTRSQPSKTISSSSTSKNSPPNHHMQLITSMKEEPRECSSSSTALVIKEEVYEEMEKGWGDPQGYVFDQVFDESFNVNLMLDSNHPDDFFADLAELEPDPTSLIFPKGFFGDKLDQERNNNNNYNNNKGMNPFDMFDWVERSTFEEAKRGL